MSEELKNIGGEPTPQQGQEQGQQAAQLNQQQQQQPQEEMTTVPASVLKQVQEELKQLKEQNAALQAQLAFLGQTTNMPLGGEPTPQVGAGQQQQQQPDPFEGLDDDEVLTVGDVKKLISQIQRPVVDPELYKEIQMLKLSVQDPNWQETIKNYLPEMLNSNPILGQLIQNSPNPLEAALQIAKLNPRYQQAQKMQQAGVGTQQVAGGGGGGDVLNQLNQILNNTQKPSSPDQFGGGGSISKADKILSMSDEEFDRYVQQVLSGKV